MKNTEANRNWATARPTLEFRKRIEAQATLSINELMTAGMNSTDPVVRMHATAYATWQAALKEMQPQGKEEETKGDDDE